MRPPFNLATLLCCCCCLVTLVTTSPKTSADANDQLGSDLCVVNSPLVTRFFSAWTQQPAATRRCIQRPLNPINHHHVHLVRLMNTLSMDSNDVTLEIVASGNSTPPTLLRRRLVLVLDSDVAVKWTIRSTGLDPQIQHTVIITGNSELSEMDILASVSIRPKDNRLSLMRFVERRYKWIHSISDIDSANHIRLTLSSNWTSYAPVASKPPTQCPDPSATSTTSNETETWRLLDAWNMEKKTIDGCFHSQHVGMYPRGDVHVIDLDSINEKEEEEVEVEAPPPEVHVHLAVGDPAVSQFRRNVTLVLQSIHPVTWILSSAQQLKGHLVILSEHPVKDGGVSWQQTMDVQIRTLPHEFTQLILQVTAELGPPVSYVRTKAANYMQLVIANRIKNKQKDSKVNKLSGAASHSSPSLEIGFDRQGVRSVLPYTHQGKGGGDALGSETGSRRGDGRSVTWTVEQGMEVACGSNQMTVSLPLVMADALGVSAIFLNDRRCVATRNATHWRVNTHVTQCSSTSRIDGKLTTYSNLVHIELRDSAAGDDEDFEGSGDPPVVTLHSRPASAASLLKIPIQCHYEPNFSIGSAAFDDDNVMDTVELSMRHIELYHMDIHRDKEWTVPVVSADLTKSTAAAQVVFDETLYVRTWIDGVSYIQIVTEKCWVSNSSDSNEPARLILIRNTCPAHLSVQIRPRSPGQSDGGFSFHVSKDYADLGQLFIHCKLGLCTNDPSKAQGNLKLCVDPTQYCTGRHVLKPFLDESVSTAQQILVRGPLRMVYKFSPSSHSRMKELGETTSMSSLGGGETGGGGGGGGGVIVDPQVIMLGVSTEVTVAIALASFVIGVGLTAVLWCIHMRTDPYRRVSSGKSRTGRSSVVGVTGAKCGSPMIRGASQGVSLPTQQPLANQTSQYQFSYDYDISSQSNSSESHCSRDESSPTPNSQTPMNVSH